MVQVTVKELVEVGLNEAVGSAVNVNVAVGVRLEVGVPVDV